MSDLVGFLLARIAEDEAAARAAIAPGQMHPWGDTRKPEGKPEEVPAWVDGYLGGTWGKHFARWDPARVLAECEARRRIVALHTENEPGSHECPGRYSTFSIAEGDPCPTLLLLAQPYADHPDYREEWKP